MPRSYLASLAVLGALAVILAALGAHAFEAQLVGRAATRFQTALALHFSHVPALLALSALETRAWRWLYRPALWLILAGLLLFCGGLYLAALGISEWLIPWVPYGGTAMILGWLAAAIAFARGETSAGVVGRPTD